MILGWGLPGTIGARSVAERIRSTAIATPVNRVLSVPPPLPHLPVLVLYPCRLLFSAVTNSCLLLLLQVDNIPEGNANGASVPVSSGSGGSGDGDMARENNVGGGGGAWKIGISSSLSNDDVSASSMVAIRRDGEAAHTAAASIMRMRGTGRGKGHHGAEDDAGSIGSDGSVPLGEQSIQSHSNNSSSNNNENNNLKITYDYHGDDDPSANRGGSGYHPSSMITASPAPVSLTAPPPSLNASPTSAS